MPSAQIRPLPTPDTTRHLAETLAPLLLAGDSVLLSGPIGAGKTHFARSAIQQRLATLNRIEDVPSPTFTLVQVYECGDVEIWHADLYRLTSAEDVIELGLDDAFEDAITLIEWPDRLGRDLPSGACRIDLRMEEKGRIATIEWADDRCVPWLEHFDRTA